MRTAGPNPLNDLLVRYMRERGIRSVKDLADQLGLQRSTLYDLVRDARPEAGAARRTYPSVPTLITLARALDKPTHELLYLAVPDAPGAPERRSPDDVRRAARDRLRSLSADLPDTETFLRERRAEHGEEL